MSSESKRDAREPFVMISVDRIFNYGAVAIPGATLGLSLYFGKELFTSSGIQIVNPVNEDTGEPRFNRWTESALIKVDNDSSIIIYDSSVLRNTVGLTCLIMTQLIRAKVDICLNLVIILIFYFFWLHLLIYYKLSGDLKI